MMQNIIEEMLSEIQKHKRNKEELLPFYVQQRINMQVQSYYSQILDSYQILSHQWNEDKIIKKLVKD